ncbi:MAG TPA: argininosuccinate lyase [Chloroflexota bacterium]|nr:argininosuccinate lyase [Chloroflexota bacterium]
MRLWGGRFAAEPDKLVQEFTQSIDFDRRLFRQDILGSIAHCRMLARQGIVSAEEGAAIEGGLRQVADDFSQGKIVFDHALEDVHTHVESRLRELIGPTAGKLHTARSRNDQVALDLRLFLREVVLDTVDRLARLQDTLQERAETWRDVVAPGYTHLQRAQPVLLAHHLLAYQEMFGRDADRLREAYVRLNVLPLGAGALAGLPYPIDRQFVADQLGFDGITRNSMDAVGDRDFVVEYLAAASLTMAHLSRLAEEIVLWTTSEFGYLALDDSFTTGSSIMPQKKNSDVAELIRGKVGRVYGHLLHLLVTLKGLPLAYNRDLQEDKEALFDAVDTLLPSLTLTAEMLRSATVNADRLAAAAASGFSLATDVADYLVAKGVPFREAHGLVGQVVQRCLATGHTLNDLPLDEYQRISAHFGEDVREIDVWTSIRARDVPGGTAPGRVQAELASARQVTANRRAWVSRQRERLPGHDFLVNAV